MDRLSKFQGNSAFLSNIPPKSSKIKNSPPKNSSVPKDKVSLNSNQKTPEKELTILYYMNGQYDDIGPSCAKSLINLEEGGSDENINLVAQLGRNPSEPPTEGSDEVYIPIDNNWEGVRRYEIKQDNHSDLNVGNPQDYLNIEKEIPDNALLNYIIGMDYWSQGDKEKANAYFDKARKNGIQEYMENPKSEKSKNIKKEVDKHTRWMDEAIADKHIFKSEMIEELPKETEMKDASTLEDFISWGMEKYPAKHYMVVTMAHGGAWMGASGISPKKMGESIINGVSKANENTGRNDKIDALVFNSCYMGNLESATEMKDAAGISLISENFATTGAFYDWDKFINNIQKNIADGKPFDAKQFANDMVEYYREEGKEVRDNFPDFAPFNRSYLTLSAVDNKKLQGLVDSWKDFNKVCKEKGVSDKQLFTAVNNAKNYPSSAYTPRQVFGFYNQIRDIGSIMDEVKKADDIPKEVKDAANNVKKFLQDSLINEQHMGIDMDGSQGLTMWGPTNFVDYSLMAEDYKGDVPNFAKDSGWMERIEEASSRVPNEVKNGFNESLSKIRQIRKKINDPKTSEEEKKTLKEQMEQETTKALEFKKKSDFTLEHPQNIFKGEKSSLKNFEGASEMAQIFKEEGIRHNMKKSF